MLGKEKRRSHNSKSSALISAVVDAVDQDSWGSKEMVHNRVTMSRSRRHMKVIASNGHASVAIEDCGKTIQKVF